MIGLRLYRVCFGEVGVNVLAIDMTSAIAAAVAHRGDGNFTNVTAAALLTQIDVVSSVVRSELVRTMQAEVLS
jgi:hypothetical protein